MRYSLLFFVAICTVYSSSVWAQQNDDSWEIRALMGYGTYSMKSMKEFQGSFEQTSLTIPLRSVESYPPYLTYEVGANRSNNKYTLGFYYAFQSTAGRVSYADYSGELTFDQLVRGKTLGSSITWNFSKPQKIKVYAGARAGITVTNVRINNSISIGNQLVSEEYVFKSLNSFFGPVVGAKKSWDRWSVFTELRLDIYFFNGPLTLNGKGDGTLNNNGDNVKAEWTGMRGLLGIGYKF